MSKKKDDEVPVTTEVSDPDKEKRLQVALAVITKNFGKGAIAKYGLDAVTSPKAISTGSLGLDIALGVGGLPRGTITEIFGPEGTGKTTLGLQTVASAQRAGGIAAIVDSEHALDMNYAVNLGVNADEILLSQPDSGEQALNIVQELIESRAVDVILIDSVAALVPQAEINGEVGDSHMGLQARLMSQAMRKMVGFLGDHEAGPVIIFINQLRSKIGVVFGSPETTTGGNALKFYATVRLDVRRTGAVKEKAEAEGKDPNTVGNSTRVKVVKNKVAPPFKQCEFDLIFGQGVDKAGEVLSLATDLQIIEKAGSWYSFEGERLGQGADAVKELLRTNGAMFTKLRNLILERVKKNG